MLATAYGQRDLSYNQMNKCQEKQQQQNNNNNKTFKQMSNSQFSAKSYLKNIFGT